MWSKEQELAVMSAREMVSKATVLVHYDPTRPIKITATHHQLVLGPVWCTSQVGRIAVQTAYQDFR